MKKWRGFFGLFIIALIMVSGCLGSKTPPVSRPSTPAVLVDYYRTGGFAGFNDRLVIFDNGVAVVSGKNDNHEIELNKSDIDRINVIFNNSQFSMLEGNYTARHGSADLIRYSIRYHSKTVNAEDSAIPPTLQLVIDELNRILILGSTVEQTPRPFTTILY
ncbi:MAG: hypothetical protein M0Q91_07320 [Methanoregula sp.]|jgi:hypothetical protein|nr:hypothetical protein [Methanoregula sp.]